MRLQLKNRTKFKVSFIDEKDIIPCDLDWYKYGTYKYKPHVQVFECIKEDEKSLGIDNFNNYFLFYKKHSEGIDLFSIPKNIVTIVEELGKKIIDFKSIYKRKASFDVSEVLDYITIDNSITCKQYSGENVSMTSLRYKTFKFKGTKCVVCGIEGTKFFLERQRKDNKYHFNLYGYTPSGTEVMLTKDHILPKSKGGRDRLENMQTMCCYCNFKKGNSTIENNDLV